MNNIILVYKTDFQHSYASRDLIGICYTEKTPLDIVKEHIEKNGYPKLDDKQAWNLMNITQTQGYEECEYDTESQELDTLI